MTRRAIDIGNYPDKVVPGTYARNSYRLTHIIGRIWRQRRNIDPQSQSRIARRYVGTGGRQTDVSRGSIGRSTPLIPNRKTNRCPRSGRPTGWIHCQTLDNEIGKACRGKAQNIPAHDGSATTLTNRSEVIGGIEHQTGKLLTIRDGIRSTPHVLDAR